MNVKDLEFNGDSDSPSWFAEIVDKGIKCHLYISAKEDGPDDRQIAIMDQFMTNKEALLNLARERVFLNNRGKKIEQDMFHLGAIFVHSSEENYDLDLAGSVKEKRFFSSREIPWNATVSTDNFELNMEPQQDRL